MRVPLLASLIASLLLTSAGSLYAACTSPTAAIGSQNWSGTVFRFCDGTNWHNMASQWSNGASSAIYYNAGNVGIGTVAPSAKLHVTGSSKIDTGVLDLDPGYSIRWGGASSGIYGGSGVSDMVFTVGSSERFRVNGSSGNVGIGTTAPLRNIQMEGTTAYVGMGIRNLNTGGRWWELLASDASGGLNGGLSFYDRTASLHRMVIDASGNVGVGTNVPAGKLHVNGGVYFQGLSGASSGYYLCQDSATNQVTRGGSCSLSDIRLKRDVAPLPNALSAINTLRGVSFNWKDAGRASTNGPQIGLIAQDVEKVYPQAVVNNEDGTKGLNYDALMGPMVEAIKELKISNDNIRKEFEAYKAAHP